MLLEGCLASAAVTQHHPCGLKAATEDTYIVSGLCLVNLDSNKWCAALEWRLWSVGLGLVRPQYQPVLKLTGSVQQKQLFLHGSGDQEKPTAVLAEPVCWRPLGLAF